MLYRVQGLHKYYTTKKEAFRQARNLSAAGKLVTGKRFPILVTSHLGVICPSCGGNALGHCNLCGASGMVSKTKANEWLRAWRKRLKNG